MKPRLHAKSSAKKFGGKPEDYQDIHDWFDASKSHHADVRHRAILHSTFGIYLCEQVYGAFIVNSDGKEVSVRDIGEQHVLEDLGRIPSVGDYLENMVLQPWMGGPGKARQEEIEKELQAPPAQKILDQIDQQELMRRLQELPNRLKNPNFPFPTTIID